MGRLILHAVQTDGIVYPTAYFEADDLTEAQLPYMSVLDAALASSRAGGMDAQELQKQLRLKLGVSPRHCRPTASIMTRRATGSMPPVSFSALEARLPEAVRLTAQILTQTGFF